VNKPQALEDVVHPEVAAEDGLAFQLESIL
jgi:hypothetical protein